jgi:EmrB/QacA subfamily drug resistance transporter
VKAPSVPFSRGQRLTLLACILGSGGVFLDGTIVNVALPAIRAGLHGGLGTQEWVVDVYLLTLGSLLLIGGSLGDVFGRRPVFAGGVAGFGITSLVCAVAPDAGALIAARAVQGIAGALLVPSTLALIIDTFSEQQRAAAIGSWTAWTGIATVAGPLLGGLLIQIGSWRWVFVVNVPLVLVTLWLVRRMPPPAGTSGGQVDWVGGALAAAGLAGPIFALIEQPTYGWGDPRVLVTLVAGCVLLGVFVAWERRSRAPMLPLGIFRSRNFSVGNLATLCLYGSLSVTTFFLVVFLQQVGGYRPLVAGLTLLPVSIIIFLSARRFGVLADRFGPHLFMGAGPVVCSAGLVLLMRLGAHPHYLSGLLPGVTLLGLGLALTVAPLTAAILSAAPPTHAGVASGINNAVARVAGLVAIAAVGAVVAAQFSSHVAAGLSRPHETPAQMAAVHRAASATFQIHPPAGFAPPERSHVRQVLESASVDAVRTSLLLSALLALASGVLSLIGIRNPRHEPLASQLGSAT